MRLLDHLREVVSTARAEGLKIFFVPHNRWEPGDYVSFDFPSPYQLGTARRDATAAFSQERMHAALAINGPTYAHAILTTEELLAQLSAGTSQPTQR